MCGPGSRDGRCIHDGLEVIHGVSGDFLSVIFVIEVFWVRLGFITWWLRIVQNQYARSHMHRFHSALRASMFIPVRVSLAVSLR